MLKQPLQDKRLLLLKTSNLYTYSPSSDSTSTYVANPETCDKNMYSSNRGTPAPDEDPETSEIRTKKKEKNAAGRGLKPEREGTRGLCQIFKPKAKKKEDEEDKTKKKPPSTEADPMKATIPDTEAEAPKLAAKGVELLGVSEENVCVNLSSNAELRPTGSPSRDQEIDSLYLVAVHTIFIIKNAIPFINFKRLNSNSAL
jgi:hypothetical protein